MFKSKFLKATAELAVLTYVATFLGLSVADGFDILSLAAWKTAATSAFTPVLVVLYGTFARLKGDWNSPLAVDIREDRN